MDKQPDVREMFGPWLHVTAEAPFKPAFRTIDILAFASTGLTCGIAISNLMHIVLGQSRGMVASNGLIIVVGAFQVMYFVSEARRVKAMHEEIKKSALRVGEIMADAPPDAPDGPRRFQ